MSLHAQEAAGQADVSFQQYYLTSDARRISNISALGLNLSEFLPNIGLINLSLLPALSNGRFRNGDSYLQLKGLPWKGQHWTFTAGDFHMRGLLLPVPFTNVTFPEIAARGGSLEATHGTRTFGLFYGEGNISNTPRVVLREQVPQTVMGIYWRQSFGERLQVAARFMHFSNDLAALRKIPSLLTQTTLTNTTSLNVSSLYRLAGPLKLYGEATWSRAGQEGPDLATRKVPVSIFAGPSFETPKFMFRANYTFESAAYFPLLGYYSGDRAGPFGEVRYRPSKYLEFYGSGSMYENNVTRNPALADFHTSTESAGTGFQLPGRFSVNAQYTMLNLSTRVNASKPWLRSRNQQKSGSVSRPVGRHTLRLAVRDFGDVSPLNTQRQRSVEMGDTFRIRSLVLGGGVRLQRQSGGDSRTSLFYRGSAQFKLRALSVFANYDSGNDLQNRTLFATTTVSTTIVGASLNVGKHWVIQAEVFRNNLTTELNPQSIFVLQGQGVFIPGTLAALNQWSTYFRVSRRFDWGRMGAADDLAQYAASRNPLKGVVDGYVRERQDRGEYPAEGVTVMIDTENSAVTNADGYFRFPAVPEGPRKVTLASYELPAEYEAGPTTERALVVVPNKQVRADFEVVRLVSIRGNIKGPKDVKVETILIRLLPGNRYTTPDADGSFSFYNIRAGAYTIEVDEKTLPEFAVMVKREGTSVSVQPGWEEKPVIFAFEIRKPEKPVRTVLEKK